MGALNPLALLLALLAVPIVLLYLLRLQRREQSASNTFLWRRAVLEREANTPWQRLRPNILLILQLLTLAFFVFALARPYLDLPAARPSARTILLLDASASMQATDVSPSRFEAARREAAAIIDALGVGEQLILIVVNDAPMPHSSLIPRLCCAKRWRQRSPPSAAPTGARRWHWLRPAAPRTPTR